MQEEWESLKRCEKSALQRRFPSQMRQRVSCACSCRRTHSGSTNHSNHNAADALRGKRKRKRPALPQPSLQEQGAIQAVAHIPTFRACPSNLRVSPFVQTRPPLYVFWARAVRLRPNTDPEVAFYCLWVSISPSIFSRCMLLTPAAHRRLRRVHFDRCWRGCVWTAFATFWKERGCHSPGAKAASVLIGGCWRLLRC
jgi:hypothetical protein